MKGWKTVAVGVVILLAAAMPAQAHVAVPKGGGGKHFHHQADRVRTSNCPNGGWHWSDTFTVKNAAGIVMYHFGEDLVWCLNAAHNAVSKMGSNGCWNASGSHWDYHGCDTWNSAGGSSSMRVIDHWSYSFDLYVTTKHAHPYTDAYVYADGRISGTAYSG